MTEEAGTATDPRLRDPLSEVSRKERAYLLGLSSAGIVIVLTGLVPSQITALGIQFAQTDQRTLLRLLAAVVLYFLVAFLIYAGSDFLAWRRLFQEKYSEQARREFIEQVRREMEAARAYDRATSEAVGEMAQVDLRRDKRDSAREEEELRARIEEEEKRFEKIMAEKYKVTFVLTGWVSGLRVIFEFLLPIVLALCSIYMLVF